MGACKEPCKELVKTPGYHTGGKDHVEKEPLEDETPQRERSQEETFGGNSSDAREAILTL